MKRKDPVVGVLWRFQPVPHKKHQIRNRAAPKVLDKIRPGRLRKMKQPFHKAGPVTNPPLERLGRIR
eukprot:636315-Pelagomonas_calceolata.AAC.1